MRRSSTEIEIEIKVKKNEWIRRPFCCVSVSQGFKEPRQDTLILEDQDSAADGIGNERNQATRNVNWCEEGGGVGWDQIRSRSDQNTKAKCRFDSRRKQILRIVFVIARGHKTNG